MLGLQFGAMLAGAVVTETVFSRPGLGRLVVSAILWKDYPLVQGIVLFMATMYVVVNLGVDLLAAWLRTRASATRPRHDHPRPHVRPCFHRGSRDPRRLGPARPPRTRHHAPRPPRHRLRRPRSPLRRVLVRHRPARARRLQPRHSCRARVAGARLHQRRHRRGARIGAGPRFRVLPGRHRHRAHARRRRHARLPGHPPGAGGHRGPRSQHHQRDDRGRRVHDPALRPPGPQHRAHRPPGGVHRRGQAHRGAGPPDHAAARAPQHGGAAARALDARIRACHLGGRRPELPRAGGAAADAGVGADDRGGTRRAGKGLVDFHLPGTRHIHRGHGDESSR